MAKPTPAARLRRTFHYPSDDDDDDDGTSTSPAVLDEQEQESLITHLTLQNDRRNATTHRFLTALPLLSAIPFLLDLFLGTTRSPAAGGQAAGGHILPLLGLTSLFATGWMLARLGVTETGFRRLDGGSGGRTAGGTGTTRDPSGSATAGTAREAAGRGYGLHLLPSRSSRGRARRAGILDAGPTASSSGSKSPLERHLPWLNIGLAALVLLTGLLQRLRTGPVVGGGVSPVLLGALPGVVYAVVVGAKVVMAGVDPERELSALKYGYKGA